MKVSKLLIAGVLAAGLCMAVSATADVIPAGADSNILAGVISRPALAYQDGDTIQYSVTVTVPAWGGVFGNTCRQENVDVQVTLPGGTVINFPTIPIIDPGDAFTFTSADNAAMAYVVNHADEDISHRVTATLFAISEIAHVSTDDLDNAELTRDIGTTILHPDVAISKSGDIEAFCEGEDPTVLYTYLVDNTGDEDLASVVVTDDECVSPAFVSGDTNADGFLNPTEIWTYTCSTQVTETTLNTGTVNAAGRFTGEPVSASSEWLVEELPPPTVSVSPETAEICEGGAGVELCAEVTGGVGPFTYEWSPGGETTECITVTEAGEYCVTVTDTGTGCDAQACRTLVVNENPSCTLEAVAPPVCPSTGGNFVTAIVTGGSGVYTDYLWEIVSGNGWAIVGGQGTDTLEYSVGEGADECGAFLLTVTDDAGCQTQCRIEICCTGDTFCSFTQGFWGNAGGKKCDGQTTSQLIAAALAANGGTITVGIPPRSITFNSVQCILDSLPAGGKPSALPAVGGPWTCANLSSFYKNKKQTEINNVLVGQAVALTLNLLVAEGCVEDAGDLAAWVLPAEFCVVPFDDPEACPKHYTIPAAFVGDSVADLLAAVNAALAGTGSISDAYAGATAINEGFDECATIVACPAEEICDNGCDDDFDGDVDCDDSDCFLDIACIVL